MLWLLRSFGQSAGAASVDFYNYAYTEDPIIAGSILQSGSAPSFPNKLPATAEKAWYTVAEKVGCGNSSSGVDAVLACMRSSNTTMVDILTAKKSAENPANVLGLFGPTIDVSDQSNDENDKYSNTLRRTRLFSTITQPCRKQAGSSRSPPLLETTTTKRVCSSSLHSPPASFSPNTYGTTLTSECSRALPLPLQSGASLQMCRSGVTAILACTRTSSCPRV